VFEESGPREFRNSMLEAAKVTEERRQILRADRVTQQCSSIAVNMHVPVSVPKSDKSTTSSND